jgi:deaminated glutathione amidase
LDGLVKVAVVQYAAALDKAANLATLEDLVSKAADDGAELVIAPEGAMYDFGEQDMPLAPHAESLDGPFVTALAALSQSRGVTVIAGMFESVAEDPARAYNTVVAVGPTGGLVGSYRKQHLFDALGWTESDRLVEGATGQRLIFPCGGLTVGVMTCYDVRFPELGRALVDDGATLLAVPSAWVAGENKAAQFRALATARAVENVCYVAGSVQCPPSYTGESCVIEPFGVVLTELGTAAGYAVAEVSAARVNECRALMPSLANRRWSVVPR